MANEAVYNKTVQARASLRWLSLFFRAMECVFFGCNLSPEERISHRQRLQRQSPRAHRRLDIIDSSFTFQKTFKKMFWRTRWLDRSPVIGQITSISLLSSSNRLIIRPLNPSISHCWLSPRAHSKATMNVEKKTKKWKLSISILCSPLESFVRSHNSHKSNSFYWRWGEKNYYEIKKNWWLTPLLFFACLRTS